VVEAVSNLKLAEEPQAVRPAPRARRRVPAVRARPGAALRTVARNSVALAECSSKKARLCAANRSWPALPTVPAASSLGRASGAPRKLLETVEGFWEGLPGPAAGAASAASWRVLSKVQPSRNAPGMSSARPASTRVCAI
jgi:hypothetical protein